MYRYLSSGISLFNICILCIAGLLINSINATASPQNQLSEFELWQAKQKQSFNDYQTEQQRAFVGFLKTQWPQKELEATAPRNPKPKPVTLPTITNSNKPQLKPINIPTDIPDSSKPLIIKPTIEMPKLELSLPNDNAVSVNFYGHDLSLTSLPALKQINVQLSGTGLADSWLATSKQLPELTKQVSSIKSQLKLSDWATYELYLSYAKAAELTPNQQVIFIWTAMTEQGFDVRVAYDKQQLYLLAPTLQPLYETGYVRVNKQRFYFIGNRPRGAIHIYNKSVFDKSLDLSFAKTVQTANTSSDVRQLTDKTTGVSIRVGTNDYLADYYLNHPQVDLTWYFQSTFDAQTKRQILTQFEPILAGRPTREKLTILLSFVQHAFSYQLDKEQWGREYYAAPQHTINLAAVDCEDRSFLFAWLVKNLVDLEVVGLLYPGHVAVAVQLDERQAGDVYYQFNNRKYVITDPTYIGAEIGNVMPNYRDVMPKVIPVVL